MVKAAEQMFEGRAIIGQRVKILGATGIKTDLAGESGKWFRVTIEGPGGKVTHDPQKGGFVRELEITASQGHSTVEEIETPSQMEGQTTLGDAVKNDQGEPVTGPETAED